MSDQVVPNTDHLSVASMAVAWEIVRSSYRALGVDEDGKGGNNARLLAEEVRRVYLHLFNGDAIPDSPQS